MRNVKKLYYGISLILLSWISIAHAEEAQFNVFEYRIEGATLLPVVDIEKAVYEYLGEKKTIADVEKAREALERAYHDAGYLTALVTIPQQKVDNDVVRLTVIEAPVNRLRVVGSRYYSLGEIKARVPELAEGNVPYFPEMQKQLSALNRSADRKIAPVLRPGRTPGTVEVDLKVDDRLPLHGSIELNDRHSVDTTRTRLSANLRWDNLWQKQHGIGITVQTAPEKPEESKVFSLNYTWPLESGNYLAFYAVHSTSDVAAVGTLNVVGNGNIFGARYIKPLPGDDDFFHSATFGVDYKDFDQTVVLLGGGDFNTPIRYMPFIASWDGTWLGKGRTTKADLALNFHLRDVIGNEEDFANKRFKGRSNYAYLRGNVSHTETWQQGWGVSVRAGAQITSQPLISNEQLAIGGAETVRGYLESTALGDVGATAGFEAFTPNYAKVLSDSITDLHFLAFIEGGQVRVRQPLPGQDDRFTLAGAGVGMRIKGWQGALAELDWARALKNAGTVRSGDNRVHFRLGFEW